MSLKARLSLALMGLVTIIVVGLSAMSITRILDLTLNDLRDRAELHAVNLRDNLLARIKDRGRSWDPPPEGLPANQRMWTRIIEQDPEVSRLLERAVVNSRLAVRIYVASNDGRILASNPIHRGSISENLPRFVEWNKRTLFERLRQVLFERDNYVIDMPIGIPTESQPSFTINVIVSSALIRNALTPELRHVAVAWGMSLLGSLAVALLFANIVLRPLGGLGQAIDRIRRGDPEPEGPVEEAQEFVELRSKLGTLARDFLGTRQDVSDLRADVGQLMERLDEAVLLFGRDGRLRSAGASAERLLGRGRRDLQGVPIAAVFPASTPVGRAIQEAVRSRRPFRDQTFLFDRGAKAGRLLVSVEFLEDQPLSNPSATMITLRDGESRRQIVSHIVDISNRMAAIRRLTSGVAHEMKNPLNAIALEIELLKSRLATGTAHDTLLSEIGSIDHEVARLDRVIKTFLDFTQPVELKLGQLTLADVVREVVEIENVAASNRGIVIKVEDNSGGATILGDAALIRQAVQNVVNNGVEATNPGGTLQIQLQGAAGEVVLNVMDEGPGVPPDIRDRVFDLYFTTKKNSAGIGLAVAAQVVQLHGGTIECLSEPGKNTTFRMRFPNGEATEAMEAQEH
jgi:signal transduction histidine kinase